MLKFLSWIQVTMTNITGTQVIKTNMLLIDSFKAAVPIQSLESPDTHFPVLILEF